jgi:hypothetical protein
VGDAEHNAREEQYAHQGDHHDEGYDRIVIGIVQLAVVVAQLDCLGVLELLATLVALLAAYARRGRRRTPGPALLRGTIHVVIGVARALHAIRRRVGVRRAAVVTVRA